MVRVVLALMLCLVPLVSAEATSRGHFKQGYQALLRRDYDKGIEHLSRAIDIGDLNRTNLALAYHYRGALYLKRERVDEAILDLDRAIALDPKLATAASPTASRDAMSSPSPITARPSAYGPNGTIGTFTAASR
jgi:tetratricopeptide (TPR) repeat protein